MSLESALLAIIATMLGGFWLEVRRFLSRLAGRVDRLTLAHLGRHPEDLNKLTID